MTTSNTTATETKNAGVAEMDSNWKPLDKDAFELWQSYCTLIGGHTPLVWDGLTKYARLVTDGTRGLNEDELRELVHKADVPAGHEKCSNCDRKAIQLETALLFPDGTLKTRGNGEAIMRGAYLLIPRADKSGKVDAVQFCHPCQRQVRELARAEGSELVPMTFKTATWLAEKINARIDFASDTASKYQGRFSGSSAQRSAPRNSPDNVGRRR